jgi:hypothetical protein
MKKQIITAVTVGITVPIILRKAATKFDYGKATVSLTFGAGPLILILLNSTRWEH